MSRNWDNSSVDWADLAKWELFREVNRAKGITCEQVIGKVRGMFELLQALADHCDVLVEEGKVREEQAYREGYQNGFNAATR